MKKALGLFEVTGLANCIVVCDLMLKTSDISIDEIEKTRGKGLHLIKIKGDVSAVKSAIDAGIAFAEAHNIIYYDVVIANPGFDNALSGQNIGVRK